MIQIYKTVDGRVQQIENYEKNCWIRMTSPTAREIEQISSQFNIEKDYLQAALDRQEVSRVEEDEDNGNHLITINSPSISREDTNLFQTIPIGIIETDFCVVTVCLERTKELNSIVEGKVKHVFTNLKTRFILQMIYQVTSSFVQYLREIHKLSSEVEHKLHLSLDNNQLFQMLNLEKSTVFFSTALKSNQLVVERLERGRILKLYEDDGELLEDIQIEIDQAVSMCNIYSNILSGTMDAFASIISNNLNIVMKVLTAITILISIPTLIASYYGMNVAGLPFPSFNYVLLFSIIATSVAAFVLYKFNMFS